MALCAESSNSFNILSICSGIGGLDLAMRRVLPNARTVCYVEREAFAASVLVARMEDSSLDRAPLWDDLFTFDGKPWRGLVDCVIAGFPCQPFSRAGRRAGAEHHAWLWPEIRRVLSEIKPTYGFFENVPPLLRNGMEKVLGDLHDLGFDAQWEIVSAEEIGAPHGRGRVFILADSLCERNGYPNQELCAGRQATVCRSRWPTEPNLDRVANGVPDQVDRLRALGNAVVPQQAAHAFYYLLERAQRGLRDQR